MPVSNPAAYAIAVGAVGLGLVAFLIGAAIIAAGGKPVPTQYSSSGSAISGALVGILAPMPTARNTAAPEESSFKKAFAAVAVALKDLWANRAMFILTFVFVVTLVLSIVNNSAQLRALAAAAGGALIGLLAPPPNTSVGGPSA